MLPVRDHVERLGWKKKLEVIKNYYKSGKSVMAIVYQSGIFHFTKATILKNDKIMKAIKGSALLKAKSLTKIQDVEILLMTRIEYQAQKHILTAP